MEKEKEINSDQDELKKNHSDTGNIYDSKSCAKSKRLLLSLPVRIDYFRFRLQRNELKCDPELYPECAKKGKPGQQARQKFRPDPREAMWTKIHRGLRLAPLEVKYDV